MATHKEFKIAGHSVLFPCKPYPSQFSMMDKIIKGIERNQNCLLESPTGSGKSLALLCSALAWQTAEKKKQDEEFKRICEEKSEVCTCSCHCPHAPPPPPSSSTTSTAQPTPTAAPAAEASPLPLPAQASGVEALPAASDVSSDVLVVEDDSDEDFKPLKKFKEPVGNTSMSTRKKKVKLSIEYEDSPPPSPSASASAVSAPPSAAHSGSKGAATPGSSKTQPAAADVAPCSHCNCAEKGGQTGVPRKVPKIFFGTRTHKQVAQIVRELRKTAYHDAQMTILASREHTCIHPQVSSMANKNEGCENLMKDSGCRLKDRVMKFQSQQAIKTLGLNTAWDLEDLVHLLKKKQACPYFLSRGLKEQSDLIICPYNYLVDPLIRESMEINLKGQIVLLDEAHNIEDSAREAASQSITQEQIQKALHDMDVLIDKGKNIADVSKLRQMCHKLDMFIEDQSSSLTQHDFDKSYTLWSGFEIVAQLQKLDLGPQSYEHLKAALASVKADEQEERQYAGAQDIDKLSSAALTVLEQTFLVLHYMYRNDMKHAEDYRASIVKSVKYVAANLNGSWMNSRRNFGGRKTPVEVYTLNFWCMNPAVSFADFENCRSVVLTSGTLSPMDTFQSELGLPFPIVLEANHVIDNSQVWVGAVGQGPNGAKLQAVYRNMETFDFQDGLGQLILGVCKKVPKGVLCFLPSYKTLEKLTTRWKTTGLFDRMQEHKRVLCEPRGSDKMDFEQIIQGFYNVIHGCEENGGESEGVDGALFFAVCRGKVSEGMDFADNFARAVITVGIPYPNFKDIQVELKRKYNDKYHSSRRLLSGSLWYEIQAFRALNQALGRCIRHRKDWGALIIVDDRFVQNTNKYANGLSKWVRQKLKVHHNFSGMLGSLEEFTQSRLEADRNDDSLNSSLLPSTPLTPASQPVATVTSPPDWRAPLHDVSNVSSTSSPAPPPPPQTSSITMGNRAGTSRGQGRAGDDVVCTGVSSGNQPTISSMMQGNPKMRRLLNATSASPSAGVASPAPPLAWGGIMPGAKPASNAALAPVSGVAVTRINPSMLYVPLSRGAPTLRATLFKLPTLSPTQTLLRLPPQYCAAAGTDVVVVPPGIMHVALAFSIEEATALFKNSLKMQPPFPPAPSPSLAFPLPRTPVSSSSSSNSSALVKTSLNLSPPIPPLPASSNPSPSPSPSASFPTPRTPAVAAVASSSNSSALVKTSLKLSPPSLSPSPSTSFRPPHKPPVAAMSSSSSSSNPSHRRAVCSPPGAVGQSVPLPWLSGVSSSTSSNPLAAAAAASTSSCNSRFAPALLVVNSLAQSPAVVPPSPVLSSKAAALLKRSVQVSAVVAASSSPSPLASSSPKIAAGHPQAALSSHNAPLSVSPSAAAPRVAATARSLLTGQTTVTGSWTTPHPHPHPHSHSPAGSVSPVLFGVSPSSRSPAVDPTPVSHHQQSSSSSAAEVTSGQSGAGASAASKTLADDERGTPPDPLRSKTTAGQYQTPDHQGSKTTAEILDPTERSNDEVKVQARKRIFRNTAVRNGTEGDEKDGETERDCSISPSRLVNSSVPAATRTSEKADDDDAHRLPAGPELAKGFEPCTADALKTSEEGHRQTDEPDRESDTGVKAPLRKRIVRNAVCKNQASEKDGGETSEGQGVESNETTCESSLPGLGKPQDPGASGSTTRDCGKASADGSDCDEEDGTLRRRSRGSKRRSLSLKAGVEKRKRSDTNSFTEAK